MSTIQAAPTVDRTALKVNQGGIVLTLLVAFILSAVLAPIIVLVPLLALVMIAGSLNPSLGLFRQLYLRLLRPAGLLRPRPLPDNPRPHAFAQLLGGIMLLIASLVFWAGLTLAGWILVWVVIALAFVNLAFDF
jgi:hypothetical protein